MKITAAVVFLVCFAWFVSAQCPGPPAVVGGGTVSKVSTGGPIGSLWTFVSTGTDSSATCMGAPYGPTAPTLCEATRSGTMTARINILFPLGGNNTAANYCIFNCNGTCRMRGGDGLPVELMDFSIDEGSKSSTAQLRAANSSSAFVTLRVGTAPKRSRTI